MRPDHLNDIFVRYFTGVAQLYAHGRRITLIVVWEQPGEDIEERVGRFGSYSVIGPSRRSLPNSDLVPSDNIHSLSPTITLWYP